MKKNDSTADDTPEVHEPCIPCVFYQQAMQFQMVPLFWRILAAFHGIVVIIFAVTLILIAVSLNTNITAERLTREAALQAAGDNRSQILSAINGPLLAAVNGTREDIHAHMRMTMENRTVQSEILGILLRREVEKHIGRKP